jgi:8-oxo-dGTP pyrophosphatase MutT (NUDIX family)
MIDPDGYRPNVGIVLLNEQRQVFWAQRVNNDGWQFPQGGMNTDETPEEAMYRELKEETGLSPGHVELLGSTPGWLRYRLPRRFQRHFSKPANMATAKLEPIPKTCNWHAFRLVAFRPRRFTIPCLLCRGSCMKRWDKEAAIVPSTLALVTRTLRWSLICSMPRRREQSYLNGPSPRRPRRRCT